MAAMAFADSGLLMQFAALIAAVGTQLLPSLIKNKLFWIVWGGFFTVTVFGQLTYLTKNNAESNENRAKTSLMATDIQTQLSTLIKEKDAMKCRDISEILADQKIAISKKERVLLHKEYLQANHKAEILEKIDNLEAEVKIIHAEQNVDQVSALLAKVSGYSASLIFLTYRLVLSLVITLGGMFLWNSIFNDKEIENYFTRLKNTELQRVVPTPVKDDKTACDDSVVAYHSAQEIKDQPSLIVHNSKQADDTEKLLKLKNALENDPSLILSIPIIIKLVGVGTDRARRLKRKIESMRKLVEKS
jgi:hypothetical protein